MFFKEGEGCVGQLLTRLTLKIHLCSIHDVRMLEGVCWGKWKKGQELKQFCSASSVSTDLLAPFMVHLLLYFHIQSSQGCF